MHAREIAQGVGVEDPFAARCGTLPHSLVRFVVAVTLLLTVAGTAAAGPPDAGNEDKVVVTLGAAKAPAGSTALIDVSVTGGDGAKRMELQQDIRFDDQLLTFVRAQPTTDGLVSGLEVTTSVRADPGTPHYSILRLKVVSSRALPKDPVMGIVFAINDDAAVGTATLLKHKAWLQGTAGELREVTGTDAEVTVIEGVKPVFVCFLYMH